ncbi:hypothetical protein [Sandarakinorhabdus sp. DWP1-3-1]|uniref:hypothetical protein n=1 Tax=Sandarakinorhabdus sp. DWP1-3-1 TaxID=2804627 RepID=UPI003CE8EA55
MDFLKLLRSFEDLLFELLSWVIYYPLTLWRVITRPLEMLRYSNHEETEALKERYTDTLSPPLFLLVTIALLHWLELAFGTYALPASTAIARAITASDENLIIARSVLFALLPLFAAWRYVSASGRPLDRKNLRPPFNGQCYLAAVYALLLSGAISTAKLHPGTIAIAAELLAVAATGWYLAIQTQQFRASLGCSTLRAAGLAVRSYLEALFAFIAAALVIAGGI